MTIKELRKSTKLSQKDFAEKYHLNLKTLQRWEQNLTPTPTFTLYAIEEIIRLNDKVQILEHNLNYNDDVATYEQVKKYCFSRNLVLVSGELFNHLT